jgi:hypothetical protein
MPNLHASYFTQQTRPAIFPHSPYADKPIHREPVIGSDTNCRACSTSGSEASAVAHAFKKAA